MCIFVGFLKSNDEEDDVFSDQDLKDQVEEFVINSLYMPHMYICTYVYTNLYAVYKYLCVIFIRRT